MHAYIINIGRQEDGLAGMKCSVFAVDSQLCLTFESNENYERAYKRIKIIITFLNGETSEDVTVEETE